MSEDRTHGAESAVNDPIAEPEVQAADLETAIRVLLSTSPTCGNPGDRASEIVALLQRDGWVLPGVPPVNQVLADARRFSDELILSNLVARFFRVMILGAVVIPETPAAMDWLRDYIDGNHRAHGPLGKPMIWPGRLQSICDLLRAWGYQPTPTTPQYVSVRPGGALSPIAEDPTAPDPAMVTPLPRGREHNMGSLLDETAGTPSVMAVDRMTAIRAMSAAFDRGCTHFDATPIIGPLTQLRDHQRQIDADGTMVGVNRQALDEVIAHLAVDGGEQP